MSRRPTVVVFGAGGAEDLPGVEALESLADLRYARGRGLLDALPGAEVLFGWDFSDVGLAEGWSAADALRWIHWGGAGVDAALFPELRDSAIALTSSRGVFDRAMAEYVAGLVLALAKRLPETLALQRRREWRWRMSERLAGRPALVVGAGSIGRAVARALNGLGLEVSGVARSARHRDSDFVAVHGRDGLDAALGEADFVVITTPLTEETRGLFDAARIARMRPGARLVNVGRGPIVDEAALTEALASGSLGGAALDVFVEEPLAGESPLWAMENVIVSPHMSGDFFGSHEALVALFAQNLRRYVAGEPLLNPVDKRLGYVR